MEKFNIRPNSLLGESSSEVRLDDKILALHNLRDLKHLEIKGCENLTSILLISSFQLVSLESLSITYCRKLFSSDIVSPQTHEDVIAADYIALPSLESLSIVSCGITGKWLSLILRHVPAVKEFMLEDCPNLTELWIEEEGNSQSNIIPASEASSSGYQNDLSASSAAEGLLCIPLNLTSSLKKITICECPHLKFDMSRKGFTLFTSLEYLKIRKWSKLALTMYGKLLLPQSLQEIVIHEYSCTNLRPCFLNNHTCLKRLEVQNSQNLKYVMLHSCKSLEDLSIGLCYSIISLPGLESLGSLRSLELIGNSMLKFPKLENFARSIVNLRRLTVIGGTFPTTFGESYELIPGIFPRLEILRIDNLSRLTTSLCKGLTCLQQLQLCDMGEARLTDEQEIALLVHRPLQNLHFFHCDHLVDLPAGLHRLPTLKTLKIDYCKCISELPKEGLPHSLEEMEIEHCSNMLSKQCRLLATSKLKVRIDGLYVN